ncbi:MAG: insulinase family protein, partial [Desulfuromonadales bacterium]|nr:insulinase family protein [Desulfuromonadales bacterium]NIS43727.1 insulinase family protein [Desulfuromonadales bacterium]
GREGGEVLELRIMQRILSGGVTARLMLRLRETLGLTYNIEANLTLLAETGALLVDFLVAPDNLMAAVREVGEIVKELWRNRVP